MLRILLLGLLMGPAWVMCRPQQANEAKFSCDGRGTGYYADVASGCQVYHMCDGLGRQFSYTCPNATLFQQRMLICDHWYMVNCSRSESDYSANLLIGQQKPFVEDSGSNPFLRTPRPDLLSHPSSETEYNIIYRTGREHDKTRTNIVGIEENEDSNDDEPTYFPPSHWSTAYPSETSTAKSSRDISANRRILNQSDRTSYSEGKNSRARPKAINFASSNRNGNNNFDNTIKVKNSDRKFNVVRTSAPVNYQSNFKATTPVFPLTVEESSEPPNNIGILPPYPYKNAKAKNSTSEHDQQVNFKSNFQATTPVFPLKVEDSSAAPNDIGILPPAQPVDTKFKAQDNGMPQVNFQSNFKATTPVFPLTVEEASEAPGDVGVLPPLSDPNATLDKNISDQQPQVNFKSNFKATTPVFPLTVDDSSVAPSDLGILPPNSHENSESHENIDSEPLVNFKSNFKATTPVFPVTGDDSSVAPSDLGILPPESEKVNFKSNFKATTPVYPTFVPKSNVELSSVPLQGETHVNFYSDFKATTPVYPKSVEATSPDPGEVGLLPPRSNGTKGQDQDNSQANLPDILLSLAPPEFDKDYEKTHEHIETTSAEPSMFYQPPKFEPDYTSTESKSDVKLGVEIENIMKSLTKEQWQNIRQRFHIPEYEFPLDDATRPSYESLGSSFGEKKR